MTSPSLYAIGDCNTEGANDLAPGENVPEKLSALLRREGISVSLNNLGHTMTTSREGLSRMRMDVDAPGLLLINYGLVDSWVTSIPQVYVPYYPDNFVRRIGRKLLKSLKRRLRAPLVRRFVPEGEVVPIDEYRSNINTMIEMAREKNPEVCVVLWTTPWARGNAERNRNIAQYNQVLHEISRASDVTCIDIGPILNEIPEDLAYIDEVHLSGRSAQKISEALLSALKNKGLWGLTV